MSNNLDWDVITKKAGYNSKKKMFQDLYIKQDLGSRPISKILGTSRWTILHQIKLLKLEPKPRGGKNNINPKTKEFEEKILSYKKGEFADMSSQEIMQTFNIPRYIFYKVMLKHKIRYKKYR
jgi:hypothetical protein